MRLAFCLALVLGLSGCGEGEKRAVVASESPAAPAERQSPGKAAAQVAAMPTAPLIKGDYAPRDECKDLPGWTGFAAELRKAVARRDAAALAALADTDVRLDFGGGAGRGELRKRLSGGDDGRALWTELDAILTLGCARSDEWATMPWLAAQELGSDPFDTALVLGDAVPLLGTDLKTPVRRLSWTPVTLLSGLDYDKPYRKARARDGTEGFVAAKFLRSPVDYRMVAERRGAAWRITVFLAGD